jgi:hypothetical protein
MASPRALKITYKWFKEGMGGGEGGPDAGSQSISYFDLVRPILL